MGSPSCCYLLADVTWKVIRWEIDRICFERDHVVLHRMVVRKQQLKRRLKKERCKVAESTYRASVLNQIPTASNIHHLILSLSACSCRILHLDAFGLECQNNHQSLLS